MLGGVIVAGDILGGGIVAGCRPGESGIVAG
jgi:hypothetical protein